MTTDNNAAGTLDAAQDQSQAGEGGDQSQDQSQDQAQGSQETFFLPKDFLGGKTFQKGDSITLQVMGTDQDGDTEVCCPDASGDAGGGDWRSELKSKLTAAGSDQGGM